MEQRAIRARSELQVGQAGYGTASDFLTFGGLMGGINYAVDDYLSDWDRRRSGTDRHCIRIFRKNSPPITSFTPPIHRRFIGRQDFSRIIDIRHERILPC